MESQWTQKKLLVEKHLGLAQSKNILGPLIHCVQALVAFDQSYKSTPVSRPIFSSFAKAQILRGDTLRLDDARDHMAAFKVSCGMGVACAVMWYFND